MALRIMSRSASVGANSAASDTDLWGANTKSKPEFFRTCSLQSAPLSARLASKRASSSSSRGSARTLATPSAAATRGDISGRPLAPAGIVGGQALASFEVPAVDGDAVDLEGLRLGLVLGHIGADQRALACRGDFGEVEHVRLFRRRSRGRRWRRRRRLGPGG